jgi:hypothetical protein
MISSCAWNDLKDEMKVEDKEEREMKAKRTPSLRYLATEILFKGYCIIFLMRFSSLSRVSLFTSTIYAFLLLCFVLSSKSSFFLLLNTLLKED